MNVWIRALSAALLLITAAIWWMTIDLWPSLPERLPLLPGFGGQLGTVPRTPCWWFGPPAVSSLAALWLGLHGPLWWIRRAAGGKWLAVSAECRWLELPVTTRVRVIQPCIAATVFVAICLQVLVGGWLAGAEANSTPQRPALSLVMLGTAVSAIGSALTIARNRARTAAAILTRSATRQPQT